MKLLIHGRNLEVTPALRDYTETKLARAVNHFNGMVQEADVHLSVARNPRVCLLYTSPSPRDISGSRMPSSA